MKYAYRIQPFTRKCLLAIASKSNKTASKTRFRLKINPKIAPLRLKINPDIGLKIARIRLKIDPGSGYHLKIV